MCKTTDKLQSLLLKTLTSYKVHKKQIYVQLISYTFLNVLVFKTSLQCWSKKNRDQKFWKKDSYNRIIIGTFLSWATVSIHIMYFFKIKLQKNWPKKLDLTHADKI